MCNIIKGVPYLSYMLPSGFKDRFHLIDRRIYTAVIKFCTNLEDLPSQKIRNTEDNCVQVPVAIQMT
jgi:hypothetical protein